MVKTSGRLGRRFFKVTFKLINKMSIVKVGCGEYRTVYLHDDGTVGATLWNGKYSYLKYDVKDIVDVAGGQYTCLGWDKNGVAYEFGQNSQGGPQATKITIPGKVVYGAMFYQTTLLVDEIGDLYYYAKTPAQDNDALRLGATSLPKLILTGYNISKIVNGENYLGLLMMTKIGEAYVWMPGNLVPTKVISSGVKDVEMIGRGVYIANMGDKFKVWGPRCNYFGYSPNITQPFDETATLLKWPLKKMSGNWNTLHVIDSNNDMWAIGDNIMGEIGNGNGCANWKDYKGADGKTPQPFSWNWLPGQMLLTLPVKLDGKWNDVLSSGNMAFYKYAINTKGQLYSWGRNKNRALGNGQTLPDNDLITKYPNWSDQWYPTPVNPDTVVWKVTDKFDPATAPNNAPFALIPPDPIPEPPKPTVKVIATIEVSGWTFTLFEDGTALSRKF